MSREFLGLMCEISRELNLYQDIHIGRFSICTSGFLNTFLKRYFLIVTYTYLTQNLHIFDQRKKILENSLENIQPNKAILKLLSP